MDVGTNPYAPPEIAWAAPDVRDGAADDDGEVAPEVLAVMRGTRAWVYLTAAALLTEVAFVFFWQVWVMLQLPRWDWGWLIPSLNLVVFGLPALLLLRYGSSLSRLLRDPQTYTLEAALSRGRGVWRVVGVVSLLLLGWTLVGVGWAWLL